MEGHVFSQGLRTYRSDQLRMWGAVVGDLVIFSTLDDRTICKLLNCREKKIIKHSQVVLCSQHPLGVRVAAGELGGGWCL